MKCGEVESFLPEFADDALPPEAGTEISRHLRACAGCRRELEALQASMRALRLAARQPGPDLWSRFQSRLGGMQGEMDCRRAGELLPAHAEGCLPHPKAEALGRHLELCPGCAAREATYGRALRALERGAAAGAREPAPDLWPSLAARLGAAISCRRVRDTLPAWIEGSVPGALALSLRHHLAGCPGCAAEEARYRASVEALERAAARPAPVDLWPAFAARLERERRPAAGSLRPWSPAALLRPLPHRPPAVAALGAAAACAALLGGWLLPRAERAAPGVTRPAAAHRVYAEAGHPDTTGRARAGGAGKPERTLRVRRVPAGRKPGPGLRPRELPPAPRAGSSGPVMAAAPRDRSDFWESQLRVAYNHTGPAGQGPVVERSSPNSAPEVMPEAPPAAVAAADEAMAEPEVMSEVVRAVGLLAEIQDAASRPFEADSDVE